MTIHCRHVTCHQCECASCATLRRERDAARAEVERLRAALEDIASWEECDSGFSVGRARDALAFAATTKKGE